MKNKIRNLCGQKFGKLTAIKPLNERKNRRVVWECICECGKKTNVVGTLLTSGNTKSCGCISKPHGMFGTRIYNVWHTMKERCYVPSQISYPNYGGRGIKVCPEWQEFIPFMEWAYSNGYDENAKRGQCTLDRIDPNGDYSPENCRWVPMSLQANNKTDNVYLEYNGVIDTLTNHARSLGIDARTAESRKTKGKNVEEIFKQPRKPHSVFYKGKYYTLMELSKKTGISRSVIYKRIFQEKEDVDFVIKDVKSHKRKPIIKNRPIIQYDLDMNFIKEWKSGNEIEENLNIKKQIVQQCCRGNNKTAYGYIWQYKKGD